MPPKKPRVGGDDEFEAAPVTSRKLTQNLGVEDLNLPKSMVQRLAKGVLPANAQVQKDAMLAISKSATVFVNYLASHANDRATLNNKKTIQPEDVFEALKDLEFGDMVERCQEEEKLYAAMLNNKRNDYRRRLKEEKGVGDKSMTENGEGVTSPTTNGNGIHSDEPPAAKRPRIDGTDADVDDETIQRMGLDGDGDETVDENEEEEDEPEEDEVSEKEGPDYANLDRLDDVYVGFGGSRDGYDSSGSLHSDADVE